MMVKNSHNTLKNIYPIIFFVLSLVSFLNTANHNTTHAASMQSTDAVLELFDPDTVIPKSLSLPTRASQERPEQPTTISAYGSIDFLASGDVISFGNLSPTNPLLRSVTLSFVSEQLPLTLYQKAETPLQTTSGDFIPPTTCDSGSCTTTQAASWQNTLTFGYGVTCTGEACESDFENKLYRQIAIAPDPARVLARSEASDPSDIELTYQLIVPGTQKGGSYRNTLSLLFVPDL